MNICNSLLKKMKTNTLFSLLRKIIYYPFYFKYRLQYKQMLRKRSLKNRFNEIYEKNLWQSKETRCGKALSLITRFHLESG